MKFFILTCLAVAVSGCLKFSDKPDSFGVSLVELTMEPKDLGRLNAEITAKRPIPAKIKIGAEEYGVKTNYAGQSTLHFIKKSYDLDFKNRRYRGSRDYRLSSQATDPTSLRSQIGFYAFELAGILSPSIEPVYLYVNREAKGLYYLYENITPGFYKAHDIDVETLYKAKLGNAKFDAANAANPKTGFRIRTKPEHATDLKRLIEYANNEPSPSNLKKISALLDIENALTYWAVCLYLNNFDGYTNNFFLYRTKTGKFRFSPWDLDRIYENAPIAKQDYIAGQTPFTGNKLLEHLLSYEDVRARYLSIFTTYYNETLPPEEFVKQVRQLQATVSEAYSNDRVLSAKGQTIEKVTDKLVEAIENWHSDIEADLFSEN